jgi:LAO/AO transport system kinase
MGLADRVLTGDVRAVARLATHIENGTAVGAEALAKLYPQTGRAHIVGITGAPGAGKSTLIGALIQQIRKSGRTVGVVAVDPTSPLSGGAALGDRIRLLDTWNDSGVYIRSMASRGRYGGLAPATAGMVHLLDAAGFDIVLVETVGVGQEEVDIAARAHTTVVLQVPGLGDDVQSLKAGLLEVADLFVVNKADRPDANAVARSLRDLIGPIRARDTDAWTPPIIKTVGTTGDGVDHLLNAIDRHHDYLRGSGDWAERTRAMAQSELRALVWQRLQLGLSDDLSRSTDATRIVSDIAERRLNPAEGAELFLASRLR